jgi:hypothetical protein
MQYVDAVANTTAKWMKDVPHLPKGLTKWLAENSWWLAIIGVVLSAFGALGLLTTIMAGSAVLVAVGAVAYSGVFLVGALISLAGIAATVIIEAMAISPLKGMKRRGWDLMFLSLLVAVAFNIVGSLLAMNIAGILFALIGAAIGVYVALELKPYFVK